jgi:hypothetical protein
VHRGGRDGIQQRACQQPFAAAEVEQAAVPVSRPDQREGDLDLPLAFGDGVGGDVAVG